MTKISRQVVKDIQGHMRPSYLRSNFNNLARGKFFAEATKKAGTLDASPQQSPPEGHLPGGDLEKFRKSPVALRDANTLDYKTSAH